MAYNNNTMVVFINDDSVAASYPVAPGFTVVLINANDPSNGKMYVKSAQVNGMPNPMRVFAIKDITPKPENGDTVSRAEFDALMQRMASMQQALEGIAKGGKAK